MRPTRSGPASKHPGEQFGINGSNMIVSASIVEWKVTSGNSRTRQRVLVDDLAGAVVHWTWALGRLLQDHRHVRGEFRTEDRCAHRIEDT